MFSNKPVSDLRSTSADISKLENEIYYKLQEAEKEAMTTQTRYTSEEVLKAVQLSVTGKIRTAP